MYCSFTAISRTTLCSNYFIRVISILTGGSCRLTTPTTDTNLPATTFEVEYTIRPGELIILLNAGDFVLDYCDSLHTCKDISIFGKCTVFLQSGGRAVTTIVGKSPYFVIPEGKTFTGKKYEIQTAAICGTANRGPDFFPGTIAGTVQTEGFAFLS